MNVALQWHRIDWMPEETWTRETLPKILYAGLKPHELQRSVYVVRLNGDYCIDYPSGESPTLYIGEGTFSQRINAHRTWTRELKELVGEFSFQIRIAVPRVRGNSDAYLDCEAALLNRFKIHFGSAPLWNKQFESRRNNYKYNTSQMDQAICKGSGAKYKWCLRPMKSSPFYRNYVRTHTKV